MPSLKEPQKAIPGGFRFYEPSTKWQPTPFSSLDSITEQLIAHRRGRPDLVIKNGWSLDRAQVRAEVEQFNVAFCQQQGWTDYLLGGAETVPFTEPIRLPLRQRAKNLVVGAETLVAWDDEGAPTVPAEVAAHRAQICVLCPRNGKGGIESYFTVPVANKIRSELERKRSMKLETPFDDKLGVCEACSCPLPLKVWMPLPNILKKISAEQKAELHPDCWILKPLLP